MKNQEQQPNNIPHPSPLNEGIKGHVSPPGSPPKFTPPKQKPQPPK